VVSAGLPALTECSYHPEISFFQPVGNKAENSDSWFPSFALLAVLPESPEFLFSDIFGINLGWDDDVVCK
jgi:hypothetical protein